MIRKIVKPQSTTLEIELPETYVGKQVEVIVFEIGESTSTPFLKDWDTPEEDEAWKSLNL